MMIRILFPDSNVKTNGLLYLKLCQTRDHAHAGAKFTNKLIRHHQSQPATIESTNMET